MKAKDSELYFFKENGSSIGCQSITIEDDEGEEIACITKNEIQVSDGYKIVKYHPVKRKLLEIQSGNGQLEIYQYLDGDVAIVHNTDLSEHRVWIIGDDELKAVIEALQECVPHAEAMYAEEEHAHK